MKPLFSLILTCFSFFLAEAQIRPVNNKKYPSLLWEISGHGLKKPSHLIGTMHVSSKMAFNLPDSFYVAIRNAQVVALESNPETWQEDMSKYDFGESDYGNYSAYSQYNNIPNEYLGIKTLRFYKYDSKIERSLYSNPSAINNLLYRSYGNETSDFEEDTYLDMYIFQCGKKWAKKVTGVEDYGESMRLMAEAYKDAAKDKNTKRRSYGDAGEEYSAEKLQEAYRTGNLDLLDSINKYNSVSAAFDEKFLYKRNEIQARSIDSILRSGATLFVGVGAAHLPGDRGVIEILRRMGYRLRPVKMGERASREKDLVDRIRVPVQFRTETSADGLFKVDIPGKFYQFGDDPALDQRQYADMSNGSYYMVTRIMTNAWMWNHNTEDVYRTIDSLLYENIPGKIISKTPIQKSGFKGMDITNRTRRGDLQRYNIFITPFEILFFKMSGNGDYVKNGVEAGKFFNSIQLKEYSQANAPISWKKYSPPQGGFSINFPHSPYVGNDGSWIYDAGDRTTGNHYRVVRTDIHNYHFVEEDSFDLGLMEESFSSSEFIDSQYYRRHTKYKGYPALDMKYRDKLGSVYLVKFIIQGPHYYTLVAHGKQESPDLSNFINSFQLSPYVYKEAKTQRDSSLYYTVNTPVFPEEKKIKLDIPRFNFYGAEDDEDEESEDDQLEGGTYRNKVISNDSTGEKILVSFVRYARYYYLDDSAALVKHFERFPFGSDSLGIVRWKKTRELPNKMKVIEIMLSDTGSSRALWGKSYFKNGVGFGLATQIDTLSQPSAFLKNFFESFSPSDTLKSVDPFAKKTKLFFIDLASGDSVLHNRAVKKIMEIELDSTDLPELVNAIQHANWNEKKYLATKTSLINKLGDIVTKAAADQLKHLYYALDDTVELQYSVLESLLQHKTQYAYNIFRDIVKTEPPVLDLSGTNYNDEYNNFLSSYVPGGFDNGRFLDELSDSLALTRTILPALLPLIDLEDYKQSIMRILGEMVDSNLLKPTDYEAYFNKFLLEARQELKKQSIAEKKKAIEKAEEDKEEKKPSYSYYDEGEKDKGNDDLNLYATLLLPYWDKNPAVPGIIQQMLRSSDKRLKYNTFLLLVKNAKPYPDSMLAYFAAMDEFRYELYSDLRNAKQLAKYPARFNNHIDLARSELLGEKKYGDPDSLVFIERLPTSFRKRNGFLYFFKYKEKKDDLTWKLAVAGLVPEDPTRFDFEEDLTGTGTPDINYFNYQPYYTNPYSFTHFSEERLKEDEPVLDQLKKLQKKLLYARRKSARAFYDEESDKTVPNVHVD